MKKSGGTKTAKRPSLKEPAATAPPKEWRKFDVVLRIAGSMLDKDTPISEESLVAFFQLQFQSEKVFKVLCVEAKEVKG